jgi:hypothetical protein
MTNMSETFYSYAILKIIQKGELMLQYRRRDSTKNTRLEQENQYKTSPLLTYCNWSYSSDYHIDLNTLKNILHSFNHEYIPFYLRIFNETPRRVVEAFLEQYQISKSSLESISQSLEADGFKVKTLF